MRDSTALVHGGAPFAALQLPAVGAQLKRQAEICDHFTQPGGVRADFGEFDQRRHMRWPDFMQLQLVAGVRVRPGKSAVDKRNRTGQACSSEMALWCRMTSSITKFKNFSAKVGSRSASRLSEWSRLIWASSRLGSLGGKWCLALSRPTFWVHLKRSAKRYTRVASILSILERMDKSSSRMAGSVVSVSEDAVES